MGLIFTKVIGMSMTAILLMIAVVLIRIPLKKAPKWFMGVLWAVVAIRLVIPIQIQSDIGFMPDSEKVVETALSRIQPDSSKNNTSDDVHETVGVMADVYASKSPYSQVANETNTGVAAQTALTQGAIAVSSSTSAFVSVLQFIWLIGLTLVLGYAVYSYISIYLKTRISMRYSCTSKVYVCDEIDTPFIFGIFRPVIYLPSGLDSKTINNVIAHERVHLERFDHIRKQVGFLIVAIHWFNPLVWLSYILFCRDIELACDERVISSMSTREKKSYAKSLLKCSTQKRLVSVYPVAFGEVGVGTRVRQILNYKKPSLYLVTVLIMVTLVLATCSFTRAADKVVVTPYKLEVLQEKKVETDKDKEKPLPETAVTIHTPVIDQVDIDEIEVEMPASTSGIINLPYKEEKREVINLPQKDENNKPVEVQTTEVSHHENQENSANAAADNNTAQNVAEKIVVSEDAVTVEVSKDTATVTVTDGNENVQVQTEVPVVTESVDPVVSIVETVTNEIVNEAVQETNEVVNEVVNEVAGEVVGEVLDDVFEGPTEVDDVKNYTLDTIGTISGLFGR